VAGMGRYLLRKNCFPARINCLSVPFQIVYMHPTVPVFEAIQQAKMITFVSTYNRHHLTITNN
jgi:hypothetical protein